MPSERFGNHFCYNLLEGSCKARALLSWVLRNPTKVGERKNYQEELSQGSYGRTGPKVSSGPGQCFNHSLSSPN